LANFFHADVRNRLPHAGDERVDERAAIIGTDGGCRGKSGLRGKVRLGEDHAFAALAGLRQPADAPETSSARGGHKQAKSPLTSMAHTHQSRI
jgi:hypothetical protein